MYERKILHTHSTWRVKFSDCQWTKKRLDGASHWKNNWSYASMCFAITNKLYNYTGCSKTVGIYLLCVYLVRFLARNINTTLVARAWFSRYRILKKLVETHVFIIIVRKNTLISIIVRILIDYLKLIFWCNQHYYRHTRGLDAVLV